MICEQPKKLNNRTWKMLGNWKASTNHQFWGCMLNFLGVPTQTFAINFHIFRTKSNKMCLKKQVAQIFGCNYVSMGHFIPTGPKSGFRDRKFIVWPTWPRGLVVKQDKVSEVKGKICNQNTKQKIKEGKPHQIRSQWSFGHLPYKSLYFFRALGNWFRMSAIKNPPSPRAPDQLPTPRRVSRHRHWRFSPKSKEAQSSDRTNLMETALNSSPCVYIYIWVFPKIGVPQNGWFILKNPLGVPLFSETYIYIIYIHIICYVGWSANIMTYKDMRLETHTLTTKSLYMDWLKRTMLSLWIARWSKHMASCIFMDLIPAGHHQSVSFQTHSLTIHNQLPICLLVQKPPAWLAIHFRLHEPHEPRKKKNSLSIILVV